MIILCLLSPDYRIKNIAKIIISLSKSIICMKVKIVASRFLFLHYNDIFLPLETEKIIRNLLSSIYIYIYIGSLKIR